MATIRLAHADAHPVGARRARFAGLTREHRDAIAAYERLTREPRRARFFRARVGDDGLTRRERRILANYYRATVARPYSTPGERARRDAWRASRANA